MNNTTQNKLADLFAKRFEEYNTKVLEELAEVISKFNGLNYSQANQLANILRYDKSYIDLVDELAKLTKKSKNDIKKVLEETIKQHIEFSDVFFKAKNMQTPVYQNDIYLKELVNAVVNASGGDFTNIAQSTGFSLLDENNNMRFYDLREVYHKVIDECVYAVSEGKETYGQAIRKTIKQLSDSGVRRIAYSNDGKRPYTQRIDTAVRRNVLDSIRQVSIESQKEFGKRFGADGVEVTVHSNPAPDHENVQGHQFTNEEFDKFQNDQDCEDVNGVKFPAISVETGGDRRSIGQYNCYHTVFSIIVGISSPLYSDEELQKIKEQANEKIEIDGKEYTRYEVTQLQRAIETQMRYAKDRHIMYKKVGDRDGMLEEQKKITQLTRKYKEISKKASIREQLNRATVSGYRPIRETKQDLVKKKKYYDFNELKLDEDIYIDYFDKHLKTKDAKELKMSEEKKKEYEFFFSDLQPMRESVGRQAILDYTDENALYNYRRINGALRQDYKNDKNILDRVNLIKQEINKQELPVDMKLYRGITGQENIARYKVGDVIKEKGFLSASISREDALNFADDKYSAILEIEVDKGTPSKWIGIDTMSLMEQTEVLLDTDAELQVLSISKYDDYTKYIKVKKIKRK